MLDRPKLKYSSAQKASEVIASTSAPARNRVRVNRPRIEIAAPDSGVSAGAGSSSIEGGLVVISDSGTAADDLGEAQQLGAHDQPGGARRIGVDSQPHAVVLIDELDHHAVLRGAVQLRHREHISMIERGDDLVELRALGS